MSSPVNTASSYKILLVEDDPVDIELVKRYLLQSRNPRFETESVNHLSKAIERLPQRDIDAVLLDLNLPDSEGLETVDRLKEAWPSGPIIVLTGLNDDCTCVDAVRHGVQDYLSKDGLSTNLLSRSILYAIERQRMAFWLTATEHSKDQFLIDFVEAVNGPLTELLEASARVAANQQNILPEEMENLEVISKSGRCIMQLLEKISITRTTAVAEA